MVSLELIAQTERSYENAFSNLISFLRTFLDKLIVENGIFVRKEYNTILLDRLLRNFAGIVDGLGFRSARLIVLQAIIKIQQDILEQAPAEDLPSQYSNYNQQTIKQMLHGAESETLHIQNATRDIIERLLRNSILTGGDHGSLLSDILRQIEIKKVQIKTMLNTLLRMFSRAVTTNHAQESGAVWYVYRGPSDPKTRSFCKQFVGKKFTLEMLEEAARRDPERNKHPVPAAVWLGGYNCRHFISAVHGKRHLKYEVATGQYIPSPTVDPSLPTRIKLQ